jgi:hypothetical protein
MDTAPAQIDANVDALTRVKALERGLQNFEKQLAEQLTAALNDMGEQVSTVES